MRNLPLLEECVVLCGVLVLVYCDFKSNAFIVRKLVRLYKLIFMQIQQLYDFRYVSVEKHPSKFTHFPRPKPSSLD